MRYRDAADQFLSDYVRHGMTPFFGLPTVDSSDPVAAFTGCRAVLLGVPHDAGVSQSPGARFAPYHVRRVSVFVVNGETFARLGGRRVTARRRDAVPGAHTRRTGRIS
jgi:arginase family enzyme